jgi:phospholipid transport system transporter-binding protein
MSKLSIIDQGSGRLVVNSDLTFKSIDGQSVKSLAFLKAGKEITIDLSRVANADSAGLALMIEWIKYTRSKRIPLRFKNVPEQLLTLAKLSGLDQSSHFFIHSDSTEIG